MNGPETQDREVASAGPDQTRALGRSLAGAAGAGTVFLLSGELGAGKTVLVKGLADGLGSEGPITSPTFVLCSQYARGRLPLYHMDLYRIPDSDIEEAGLDEPVAAPAVVAVEWPSGPLRGLLAGLPGRAVLDIEIAVAGPDLRRIRMRARNDPARALLARLAECD